MDPDACFSQLLDAIAGTDDDAAKQCAEDLSAWLRRPLSGR